MSIEETLYRLNRDTNGAIRLNLSMQTALLEQLDRAARAAGYTRSGFIAQAVREKLAGNKVTQEDFVNGLKFIRSIPDPFG